jgi:hypothetical protein
MNLLPKNGQFFHLFERHGQILCRASRLLMGGLRDGYDGVCRIEKDMGGIEAEGDRVVHDIFRHLRATFITPFESEDIQALATSLDNGFRFPAPRDRGRNCRRRLDSTHTSGPLARGEWNCNGLGFNDPGLGGDGGRIVLRTPAFYAGSVS